MQEIQAPHLQLLATARLRNVALLCKGIREGGLIKGGQCSGISSSQPAAPGLTAHIALDVMSKMEKRPEDQVSLDVFLTFHLHQHLQTANDYFLFIVFLHCLICRLVSATRVSS